MDELNEPNLIENFLFYDRREDILVACRDNEKFESNSKQKRIQNEEKEMI